MGKPIIKGNVKKYINQDYSIRQCISCGFYFVDPKINFTSKEWEAIYSDHYFHIEGTKWWRNKQKRDRKKRLDTLSRYVNTKTPNFLDMGCGEGDMLDEAVNRNWNVYGIDIADNRKEQIRDNPKIHFEKCDILDANLPGDFFEIIHMDSVFEHIHAPIQLLKVCHRLLKKNGVLFLSFPNEDSFIKDFQKLIYFFMGKKNISVKLMPFRNPYHVIGFNKKAIKYCAEKSNFKIMQIRNISGEYEWLKYPPYMKQFYMYLLLLPVYIVAHFLKRKIYLEIILQK